jgi:alpha-beta hydrolase superfamily lysophospholipase
MSAMPDSSFSYPAADGQQIAAYRWDPEGEPMGIVQITHGMGEHALRYEEFARELNQHGLEVYAQDHRGHGQSADPEALGNLGAASWPGLVADIGELTAVARAEHPGLPLILLGHSMGSFAVQQHLLDHSADVDGAILTGTAVLDLLEPALDLDQPLDLTMFNAPFQPARTDFDWLTRDEAIVDEYVADPLCGFGLDTEAAKGMFVAARRLAAAGQVARMRSDLPVYIAVGEADPVNGALSLIGPLTDRYRAAGLTDLTVRTYPDARHEILNETNRAEVFADLTGWISQTIAGPEPGAQP